MKIYTNQGIVGLGEVRDGASKTYALMLKSRLLGENPCDVDRLFRRIKQFGGHGRQGGGVSAVEIALWDLAGKAYGVPIYQMLGGKFRDRVRMYCDTDASVPSGTETGKRLKERMALGYTFLKMDLGLAQIMHIEGRGQRRRRVCSRASGRTPNACSRRRWTIAASATAATTSTMSATRSPDCISPRKASTSWSNISPRSAT